MSEFKKLFGDKWLELRTTGTYTYSHETRCGGKIVSILIIDRDKPDMVLGRFENTPCHFDGITLASITGGVEKDDVVETAIHEVREEAGYEITKEDLVSLGTVRTSKSSDTTMYLYACDVTGKKPLKPTGDGSEGEKDAYVEWVSVEDALVSKDPTFITSIARLILVPPVKR